VHTVVAASGSLGEKNGGRRNGKCKLMHRERNSEGKQEGAKRAEAVRRKKKTERQIKGIRKKGGGGGQSNIKGNKEWWTV